MGKPYIFKTIDSSIKIDENIDITFFIKIASGIGAKNAQFRNWIPLLQIVLFSFKMVNIWFIVYMKVKSTKNIPSFSTLI